MIVGGTVAEYGGTSSGYGGYPISQYFQQAEGVDPALQGFDVYKLYKYGQYSHPTHFFGYWDCAHNINPWYRYALKYITSQIFSNYHFEGEGANEVEEFWDENNMYTQISQLGEATIKYGTGIARKLIDVDIDTEEQSFGGLQTLYTPHWQVKQDEMTWDEEWSYFGKGSTPNFTDTWEFGAKYMDQFVILRPFARPEQVWGFSPLQSSVHSLESLHAIIIQDLPAAARNMMANRCVLKVNLDNVEEAEQEEFVKGMDRNLSRFNSGRASSVAIHDIHEVGWMSGIGGGAVGGRLEDMMKFMSPMMICIFANIDLPVGILMPENSNKASIKRQSWQAEEMIASAKRYFASEVKRQIIDPHINYTGSVKLVHDLTFEMQDSKEETAVKLFASGIVPREYAQLMVGFDEDEFKEKFGITELTYAEDIQMDLTEAGAKAQAKFGNTQPKAGSGMDTRGENEKGEENDSPSGTKSEVKG